MRAWGRPPLNHRAGRQSGSAGNGSALFEFSGRGRVQGGEQAGDQHIQVQADLRDGGIALVSEEGARLVDDELGVAFLIAYMTVSKGAWSMADGSWANMSSAMTWLPVRYWVHFQPEGDPAMIAVTSALI